MSKLGKMPKQLGIESPTAVLWNSICATSVAAIAVAIGVILDLEHFNQYCSPAKCNWTARAGAVVIVCGTYLAFKAAAVLITLSQGVLRTNPQPSFRYGALSFLMLAGGTLLWAFGDLIPIIRSA